MQGQYRRPGWQLAAVTKLGRGVAGGQSTEPLGHFADEVLELPAGLPPGPCRLEVAAEDALAGGTAATTLPLEIVRR
jgi:hypothetical protein